MKKTPSILPTLRPLFSPFFLMYAHTALVIATRLALPLMPVTFARAADCDTGLKRPEPFFFMAAALFLPAAFMALLLCWPSRRLPPGKRTFFAFFFFGFLAFLAFLAFFAFGFLAAFFAFFFLAAVSCVRARLFVIAFFTTVVSVATSGSSSKTPMRKLPM